MPNIQGQVCNQVDYQIISELEEKITRENRSNSTPYLRCIFSLLLLLIVSVQNEITSSEQKDKRTVRMKNLKNMDRSLL